jgi:toxin ParE1/3/4
MRQYKLTIPAELDYIDILANTLETWGLYQFEKYANLLDTTFQKLAENPHLGKNKHYIPDGCLLYLVKSHLIIYRAASDNIEIIRLLHKKQSITPKLF